MPDDLNKRLEQSQYGTPKVNPDEQRKYLGTFRERCYISMTLSQMEKTNNKEQLQKHLADYSESSLLINGRLPEDLQETYIAIATQSQKKFTVVDGQSPKEKDPIGLLVISSHAVNEDVIDIEKKFANKSPIHQEKKETKKSFWNQLFR
ncbi:MAG TPA: YueI family protein [Candidatus Tetragenococcus pullicola]|nr:YueI family protein [Candidatus Tetragenococcus pullicola]